ncbi:hypothetical protein V8C43DRAFT_260976 [Trichoderma afarasin]
MHLHVSCISIGQHRASLIFLFLMLPLLGSLSACLGYLKLSLPLCLFCLLFLFLSSFLLLLLLSRFVFPLFKLFQLNPFSGASYLPSPKTSRPKEAPDTPLLRCCPTIASCS